MLKETKAKPKQEVGEPVKVDTSAQSNQNQVPVSGSVDNTPKNERDDERSKPEILVQYEAGKLDMTDSRVRFKVDKAKREEEARLDRIARRKREEQELQAAKAAQLQFAMEGTGEFPSAQIEDVQVQMPVAKVTPAQKQIPVAEVTRALASVERQNP